MSGIAVSRYLCFALWPLGSPLQPIESMLCSEGCMPSPSECYWVQRGSKGVTLFLDKISIVE